MCSQYKSLFMLRVDGYLLFIFQTIMIHFTVNESGRVAGRLGWSCLVRRAARVRASGRPTRPVCTLSGRHFCAEPAWPAADRPADSGAPFDRRRVSS
jgi:hypothetical protein